MHAVEVVVAEVVLEVALETGETDVHVPGYGRNYGDVEYVFNEIGRFRGQTLIEDLSAGTYYLGVTADGTWSIRFTR